ncbi:hypothetical protein C8J57DRAFT_1237773 [Mycena rebaudengoi]|nr:hypothetical protein C8J57DRAFT_1237773 [Mycena rebaudengoi]
MISGGSIEAAVDPIWDWCTAGGYKIIDCTSKKLSASQIFSGQLLACARRQAGWFIVTLMLSLQELRMKEHGEVTRGRGTPEKQRKEGLCQLMCATKNCLKTGIMLEPASLAHEKDWVSIRGVDSEEDDGRIQMHIPATVHNTQRTRPSHMIRFRHWANEGAEVLEVPHMAGGEARAAGEALVAGGGKRR